MDHALTRSCRPRPAACEQGEGGREGGGGVCSQRATSSSRRIKGGREAGREGGCQVLDMHTRFTHKQPPLNFRRWVDGQVAFDEPCKLHLIVRSRPPALPPSRPPSLPPSFPPYPLPSLSLSLFLMSLDLAGQRMEPLFTSASFFTFPPLPPSLPPSGHPGPDRGSSRYDQQPPANSALSAPAAPPAAAPPAAAPAGGMCACTAWGGEGGREGGSWKWVHSLGRGGREGGRRKSNKKGTNVMFFSLSFFFPPFVFPSLPSSLRPPLPPCALPCPLPALVRPPPSLPAPPPSPPLPPPRPPSRRPPVPRTSSRTRLPCSTGVERGRVGEREGGRMDEGRLSSSSSSCSSSSGGSSSSSSSSSSSRREGA